MDVCLFVVWLNCLVRLLFVGVNVWMVLRNVLLCVIYEVCLVWLCMCLVVVWK